MRFPTSRLILSLDADVAGDGWPEINSGKEKGAAGRRKDQREESILGFWAV